MPGRQSVGVGITGKLLYQHPDYLSYQAREPYMLFGTRISGDRKVIAASGRRVMCFKEEYDSRYASPPQAVKDAMWYYECNAYEALAFGANAVLVGVNTPPYQSTAENARVVALSLTDGKTFWEHGLPGAVARWGITIDRDGRIIVTLKDGRVLCLGAAVAGTAARR